MVTVQGLEISKSENDNITPQPIDFNFIEVAGLMRGAYLFFNNCKSPESRADFPARLLKDNYACLPAVLEYAVHPSREIPTRGKCLTRIKGYQPACQSWKPKPGHTGEMYNR